MWVQADKKATPPLIHSHFNEHASIEVHVLNVQLIAHIETCMSLKLCLCMILVIIMVEILIKSYMKHLGQLTDV